MLIQKVVRIADYYRQGRYFWRIIFYWPWAELLTGAHGTLRFRGTPVENYCVEGLTRCVSKSYMWLVCTRLVN